MCFLLFAARAEAFSFPFRLPAVSGDAAASPDTTEVPKIPEFPPPRLERFYIPPADVPLSRIVVPVTLTMDDLTLLANRNMARQYHGDTDYLEGTVEGKLVYDVRRDKDVQVTEDGGKIKISIPAAFRARFTGSVPAAFVRVPFSTQTEGEVNVFIKVKPGVRRDWSIKTDTEVDFEWTRPPQLKVLGIPIGLQRVSDKFLRDAIRDNLYKVDEVLNNELRLRERMQREWDNFTLPVKAADSVFLHLDPRGVAASPLEVTSHDITLRACVETGISLSVGLGDSAPVPARKRNLPPLEEYVQGDESITLNVKTLLNYGLLEQEANRALSGVTVDLGVASVAVNSLRLAGSGEKLMAAADISAGASKGTIYAFGEPHFDEAARVLSIRNFGFDEGTRAGLIGTAAWLLRPALMNFLSGKLEWDLGPEIDRLTDEARAIIASRVLSDEFEFKGTLESVKFEGLRVSGEGIEIGLNLAGTAALTYMPLVTY